MARSRRPPGFLGPDRKSTTIVNLKAGHYGVFCFIPAPDGAPHMLHGMVKTFDVGLGLSYKPPTDGVTSVSLSDSAITVPARRAEEWLDQGHQRHQGLTAISSWPSTSRRAHLRDCDAYFNEFFSSARSAGEPAWRRSTEACSAFRLGVDRASSSTSIQASTRW